MLATMPVLDLDRFITSWQERHRQTKFFRYPLFVFKKIWVINEVLLSFALVCQPAWRIFEYIEYFSDEKSIKVCSDIFLQRLQKHDKEQPDITDMNELAGALNRISHLARFDSFLGYIIEHLPENIYRYVRDRSDLIAKWMLLSQLLSQRMQKDTAQELVLMNKWFYALQNVASVKLEKVMTCTIIDPQSKERIAWIRYVEGVKLNNIAPSDILIIRGHGIPRETFWIIQKAQPKIVFFWWCQSIDNFLSLIWCTKNREMPLLNNIVFIGTTRFGRGSWNDTITDKILSAKKEWTILNATDLTSMTNGEYQMFCLEKAQKSISRNEPIPEY